MILIETYFYEWQEACIVLLNGVYGKNWFLLSRSQLLQLLLLSQSLKIPPEIRCNVSSDLGVMPPSMLMFTFYAVSLLSQTCHGVSGSYDQPCLPHQELHQNIRGWCSLSSMTPKQD